jgi:Lsr2
MNAGNGSRRTGRSRSANNGAADSTAVRVWAKSRGIEVKDRGRLPAELVKKFKAATGQ